MKKILITGAAGFVGHHFLDYLENQQLRSQVLGVDLNLPKQIPSYKHVNTIFKKIDLLNWHEVEKTLFEFQPNYALHLASYSSVAYSWKEPVLSFQNNMNIFLNLVEIIRRRKLNTRVLSVGSSEVYGNINNGNFPLVEESSLDPVSPYAVARVSQEFISKIYGEAYDIDIVITRSFNHVGPRQSDIFVISSFARQLMELKKLGEKKGVLKTGNLEIIRDFVDVRDVVNAYYMLLTKGVKGRVYNVCSGAGHTLKEVLYALADIAGIDITTRLDPALVRPSENKIIIGSNKRICDEIGWNPIVPLQQSLMDILNYWEKVI